MNSSFRSALSEYNQRYEGSVQNQLESSEAVLSARGQLGQAQAQIKESAEIAGVGDKIEEHTRMMMDHLGLDFSAQGIATGAIKGAKWLITRKAKGIRAKIKAREEEASGEGDEKSPIDVDKDATETPSDIDTPIETPSIKPYEPTPRGKVDPYERPYQEPEAPEAPKAPAPVEETFRTRTAGKISGEYSERGGIRRTQQPAPEAEAFEKPTPPPSGEMKTFQTSVQEAQAESKIAETEAGKATGKLEADVGEEAGDISEETAGISAGEEASASLLESGASFLGDLLPFVGIGAAIYGAYSGIKGATEGEDDPYAKIRPEIAKTQQKLNRITSSISADQFASHFGGRPPAFGSIAVPSFTTTVGGSGFQHF
tara:strand:- start:77 stop:1189 length:1113 start_codon:yes stop_codon:yes gene_type:complete